MAQEPGCGWVDGEVGVGRSGLASEDDECCLVCQLGILVEEELDGLVEEADALAWVGDFLGGEEDEFPVGWEQERFPALLSVHWGEEAGVDGVGDVDYGLSCEQGALPCLVGYPLAAAYEGDGGWGIDPGFPAECLPYEGVPAWRGLEQRALGALGVVLAACA